MKLPDLWGVINLTSDSFYRGSRATADEAVRRAAQMFEDGAAVVDAGAESTRPGALDIPAEQQLELLIPFVAGMRHSLGDAVLQKISIDTRDIRVMQRMVEAGVGFINDVSGGNPEIYRLIAESGVGYVLMHTRGTPQDMQKAPVYTDVVAEVEAFLLERSAALQAAGMPAEKIIWDTGIGFGKTPEHNLRLIAAHPRFRAHGYRVLAGVSRKSFIGKILGLERPEDRLTGTLAVQAYLTLRGCDILRVHDVKEMAQVLQVMGAISEHEL